MKVVNLRMVLGYYIPFKRKFQPSEIYQKLSINEIAGFEVLIKEIVREQIYDD